TYGSAQGTTEPTARNLDCTPTPHCRAVKSHATIEYVATTGSGAIRELAQIEVEQITTVGRDDRDRHLRMRQRRLDLVGRGRSHDDRRARVVGLVKALDVRDLVQHERVGQLELALDGDLGDAPAGRPEPALSHNVTDSPGSIACTSTPAACCLSSSGVPASSGK